MAAKDNAHSKILSHFLAIPWTAEHLNDPSNQVAFPPGSNNADGRGYEEVWAKTLNTEETFPAFIAFHRKPDEDREFISNITAFVTANHGVDGFPGMMHGGMVATLLDEVAGIVIGINQMRRVLPLKRFVTGYLNTTFIHAVPVPSTLMLTAKVAKQEGRKLLIEATIQNDSGLVLAKGDVLYIESKSRL